MTSNGITTAIDGMVMDVNSLADELAERLSEYELSEMDDQELLESIITAELFADRGRSYLQFKQEKEAVDDLAELVV